MTRSSKVAAYYNSAVYCPPSHENLLGCTLLLLLPLTSSFSLPINPKSRLRYARSAGVSRVNPSFLTCSFHSSL